MVHSISPSAILIMVYGLWSMDLTYGLFRNAKILKKLAESKCV